MQSLDWSLFHAINGLAGDHPLLDQLFKFSTLYIAFVLLTLVATLWLTPGESTAISGRRQRLVLYAVVAAVLALAVNRLIGAAWFRPRPFVHHSVTLLVPHAADNSFPSDHAAGGFALAVVVVLARDRFARLLGSLLLVLAALLAFSRVYVGAHYPMDVVAGVAIGSAAAVAVALASPMLDPYVAAACRRPQRFTARVMCAPGLRRWRMAAKPATTEGERDLPRTGTR
jgi:undecaprenyl-diphosphatase